MTTNQRAGNLASQNIDSREIFEESMKMLGWDKTALNNRTEHGYSDQRLQWAWMSWAVSRSAAVIEIAALADKMQQPMLAQMIRALSRPI